MAARASHKEAQDLHKHLGNRQTLAVLPHRTEQAVNHREQTYVAQVHGEDAQTGPAGELIVTRQNGANLLFFFTLNPVIFCYKARHLLGCVMLNGNFIVNHYKITRYAHR